MSWSEGNIVLSLYEINFPPLSLNRQLQYKQKSVIE